jgi:hypothetical protein
VRPVAARAGEDRGEDGDAEDAPSSRIALLAPDAWPSSSGLTELRTTFATGAKNNAIPIPERTNGVTSCEYGTVGIETAAIQVSPAAWSVSPTAMIRAPPIRSESAPAIGATKIGMAVQGRMRSPAPNGS